MCNFLGSSIDPHRAPASQVRATAASIFVQLTEGTSNDGGTKSKPENAKSKMQESDESALKEAVPNDLPFLQIQGKGIRPYDILHGADHKSTNSPATTTVSSTTTSEISSGKTVSEKGEKHGPQDRFKVVKIETVVAKEIGRWTLVDYANRSAPVMPSNPTYFPAHISPAMSLTSGGKPQIKSAVKASASKPADSTIQNAPTHGSTQPTNMKHIPATSNQPNKVFLSLILLNDNRKFFSMSIPLMYIFMNRFFIFSNSNRLLNHLRLQL